MGFGLNFISQSSQYSKFIPTCVFTGSGGIATGASDAAAPVI